MRTGLDAQGVEPSPPTSPNRPPLAHLRKMSGVSGFSDSDRTAFRGSTSSISELETEKRPIYPFPNDEPEQVATTRIRRLLYAAVGLLALLVVGLIVGLVVTFTKSGPSSSDRSTANVGVSGQATTSPTVSPSATSTYAAVQTYWNNSNWAGGCGGCGGYGSYGGAATVNRNTQALDVFGLNASLADPVECNAYSVFAELSLLLDNTNVTSLTSGFRAPFLRALFHDAGTFNRTAQSLLGVDPTVNVGDVGGMDGSLILELEDRNDNRGIEKVAQLVERLHNGQSPNCPWLSRADITAMGAILSASSPNYTNPYYRNPAASIQIAVPIYLGRVDATTANPQGRLPPAAMRGDPVVEHFASLYGFTAAETAALSLGSHSLGGVNVGGAHTDPPVGTTFARFFQGALKGPPAIVDTSGIELGLAGTALIPSDNDMARTVISTRGFVTTYSRDLNALYDVFYPALLKMSLLGQEQANLRIWTPPLAP